MLKEKYGKNSPSRTHPLTLSFAFSHPAHIWATFFGVGLLRPGPGTWGTVAGTLVYALYAPWLSFAGQTAVAIAALVLALWACGRTVRDAGVDDHGSIVIDEVVAMWLALPFVPPEPLWWAAAIVVFRIFDVFKFWPICWLDRNLKGGLGVMMDDVAAAFFMALVLVLGGALLF